MTTRARIYEEKRKKMRRSWRLLGTPQSGWDARLTLRRGRGLVGRWVQAFQLPCGARKPRQGGQGVHSPAPPATGGRAPGNRHPGGACKKRDLSAHVGRDLRGQQPGPGYVPSSRELVRHVLLA